MNYLMSTSPLKTKAYIYLDVLSDASSEVVSNIDLIL